MSDDDEKKARRKALSREMAEDTEDLDANYAAAPMSLDEIYKAVVAFDTTMTPAERLAHSRRVRSGWIEKGGTGETFRSNFPDEAAEIDAAVKSLEEQYAAAAAFDASVTPDERVAEARRVRAMWLVAGGTEESFRATFATLAAEIDAADRS